MTAESYNTDQVKEGLLTGRHITILTEAWQEAHDLKVDGCCGSNTRASLEACMPDPSVLGIAALEIAIENIGNGEEGGNNSGGFVEMLHGKNYDGDPDDDGSWCAAFISHCFEIACGRLGVLMPFKRSGGAKRLYRNIGDAGEFINSEFIEEPRPGDVVCWDRGVKGSWQGHIGIVEKCENGILYTVEGNVGRYPSVVQRFSHNLDLQPRLEGFARCSLIKDD